ncbi:hypothetical protein O0Q50_23080 [Priestia aryabhattai]|uniref:DUF2178 domain-containing protein n=1 Tax=Priestia aryabhattai TaxID=412384 RepID=A0AAX6NEI5_PRIAR|nr:hypothetical protein [Priestia aryabhattai]MDU9694070.1 hypothetical protein [Priestia aryabhattai]
MKKETLNNLLGYGFLTLVTLFAASMYITDYKNGLKIESSGVLGIVVLVMGWAQFITWGNNKKAQKDELGKKITTVSAKTSYHILNISLFILWMADYTVFDRENDFGNISLFVAVCLSMLVFPIVQLISARKYR